MSGVSVASERVCSMEGRYAQLRRNQRVIRAIEGLIVSRRRVTTAARGGRRALRPSRRLAACPTARGVKAAVPQGGDA